MTIEPFLAVREGENPTQYDHVNSDFDFEFLVATSVDELVRFDRGRTARDEICKRFREGKLCYGVWDGPRLIAKMWCDFDEYSFLPDYRKLAKDEAYLFAASVDPDYRGQDVAPLMRRACYASMRELGRTRYYSYTDYFNAAARRFKAKLGARDDALKLHINLFDKWSKTIILKRYS